jgi:diguanylate cyclase (GGDEF)-like protein
MLAPVENVVQLPLQVPGRTWIMEFVARDGFGQRIHLQPLLLMLSLLLLTAVSLVFLKRSHHAALALREANGELLLRQQELDGLAHRDPLTGLANRLLLCDRLDVALAGLQRQGGSLALCLLDLDGFKAINDRFGHAAGDRVLHEVADRLQAVVRSSDTVARLGGDEFVLLLPGMTAGKGLQRLIQLLIEQMSQPIALGEEGPLVTVSASLGIAVTGGGQDAGTLLHQADAAMYQAKSAGKNCYRIFATAEAPRAEAHEA